MPPALTWPRLSGVFVHATREREGRYVKQREQRQKVMIRARMRSGVAWHDVAILNLSKGGLGIQAADPPLRGAYVEICRGRHVIIARVMWTKGHRAGLKSQDPIWNESLLAEPSNDVSSPAASPATPVERRKKPRTHEQRHDHSRLAGRAMEFACLGIGGAGMAMLAFGMVEEALAQPLSKIETALSRSGR